MRIRNFIFLATVALCATAVVPAIGGSSPASFVESSLPFVMDHCGEYSSPGFAAGEKDQFSFTLGKLETVRLQTSDGNGGCPGDTLILVEFFDDDQGFVYQDFDGGVGPCSDLVVSLAAGTFTAQVLQQQSDSMSAYTLRYVTKTCSVCGNGDVEVEQCDGDDLGNCDTGPCSAACTCPFIPGCGDGNLDLDQGEQCDDDNLASGDGCDSNCQVEVRVLDGCGQTQSDGFSPGEFDAFSLSLDSPETVALWALNSGDGCPEQIDLFDGNGDFVAFHDGESSFCPRLVVSLPAGQYTAHVVDSPVVPTGPYVLDYRTAACSVCGNGRLEIEDCEDGNLDDGDGCDSSCKAEPQVLDGCGSFLSPEFRSGDYDRYSFTLEVEDTIRIRTSNFGDLPCVTNTLVELRDGEGTRLARDDDGGDGQCSLLLVTLPPGEYEVRIAGARPYVLNYFEGSCSNCGGGDLEGEECDDGNLVPGDGCDALCRFEPQALTACESAESSGIDQNALDVFSFVLESADVVRFRTILEDGTCTADTLFEVHNALGDVVASGTDQDDGSCSQAQATLPAGNYTVRVRAAEGQSAGPYVLDYLAASCSQCGNGTVEIEACDDGNTIDGDGCDSDCIPRVSLLDCAGYPIPGQQVGESIEFRLVLPSVQFVRLDLADCFPTVQMLIRDGENELVAFASENAGECPDLTVRLEAGSYRVLVSGGNVPRGPSVLTFARQSCFPCGNAVIELGEDCDDGDSEDDDQCDTTCRRRLVPCEVRTPAPGFGTNGFNEFRLVLEMPQLVQLETTGTDGLCPGDTIIELYDGRTEPFAADDQSGDGPCSRLTRLLDPGDYRVVVRGFQGSALGLYELLYQNDACSTCGNMTTEFGERCDDGDVVFEAGEYCRANCTRTPCGQPVNSQSEQPLASDALFALRSAVGQFPCDPRVCSVNGDALISAGDALLILRAAVGASANLQCTEALDPGADLEVSRPVP